MGQATSLVQPEYQGAFWTVVHDQVSNARSITGSFSVVIEGQDMRMIEHGNCSCLALEEAGGLLNGTGVGIGSHFRSNNLDGYLTLDGGILCKVDFAHATAAK